jgi:hypothetical protein
MTLGWGAEHTDPKALYHLPVPRLECLLWVIKRLADHVAGAAAEPS